MGPTDNSGGRLLCFFFSDSVTQINLHCSLSLSFMGSRRLESMKSVYTLSTCSSTSTSVTYTLPNDKDPKPTPPPAPSQEQEVPITVHLSHRSQSAATKIQSCYRAHLIRTLYKSISAVNSDADGLERLIQRQETVDSLRSSDERERVKMNESLMALLLRLDSVPGGFDPAVRDARRKVSRRIVGLQEVVDAVCAAGEGGYYGWEWDDVVGAMEEEVCRERGGEEMERFCAQYLGFRCLERFLRDS